MGISFANPILRSFVALVIATVTLSTVILAGVVQPPVLAQSSTIDFSPEYSSGDVQVFPSLQAWYTWININGTHTIFLALHSNQAPSPVSAFVGQSYNTSAKARVFVANALMAMEVYNDTNHNGFLDANYAIPQTELKYTIIMNASQTFTTTSVQKTITSGVPHYTWGVTYGTIQGDLIFANATFAYGYGGGVPASVVYIDHVSLSYDYSVSANKTYLKTSYEIGNVTLGQPLPNVTLKGLSLSLLQFVLAVSSTSYTITANSAPFDSQTSPTSSQVDVAELNVDNSLTYEFRFNDNYTLGTNPPVSHPTVYTAVSSTSIPANAFQGQDALQLIRVQDYVKASLPDIAGLPATSDLNYTSAKLIYRISYPTWDGIDIKHDPTYVGYYVPTLGPVSPVSDQTVLTYAILGVAGVAVVAAVILAQRIRKKRPSDTVPSSRNLEKIDNNPGE